MTPVKTVFLDRDGVINKAIPNHWIRDLSEFQLLPGVADAIAMLNREGFRTVVVTNQRGLAFGRLTHDELSLIHNRLRLLVADLGGCLEEFYVCPHDRHDGCACRKPQPGLLDAAHQHRPVDWQGSFLVGDRDSDILAGNSRGVCTIKVAGPSGIADFEADGLPEAAGLILNQSGA